MLNNRFWQSCSSRDNAGNCGRAGQATGDEISHAHYIYWVPKVTNTHSEYVIGIAFPL